MGVDFCGCICAFNANAAEFHSRAFAYHGLSIVNAHINLAMSVKMSTGRDLTAVNACSLLDLILKKDGKDI